MKARPACLNEGQHGRFCDNQDVIVTHKLFVISMKPFHQEIISYSFVDLTSFASSELCLANRAHINPMTSPLLHSYCKYSYCKYLIACSYTGISENKFDHARVFRTHQVSCNKITVARTLSQGQWFLNCFKKGMLMAINNIATTQVIGFCNGFCSTDVFTWSRGLS